jgi:predicted  nucleic acid-binding Zn-ribbon protein
MNKPECGMRVCYGYLSSVYVIFIHCIFFHFYISSTLPRTINRTLEKKSAATISFLKIKFPTITNSYLPDSYHSQPQIPTAIPVPSSKLNAQVIDFVPDPESTLVTPSDNPHLPQEQDAMPTLVTPPQQTSKYSGLWSMGEAIMLRLFRLFPLFNRLQRRIEELESETDVLHKQAVERNVKISQLEGNESLLQDKIQTVAGQLAESKGDVAMLQVQTRVLGEEADAWKEERKSVVVQKEGLQNEVERLAKSVEAKDLHIDMLEGETKRLKSERNVARRRRDFFKEELCLSRFHGEKRKYTVKRLKKALEEKDTQIKSLVEKETKCVERCDLKKEATILQERNKFAALEKDAEKKDQQIEALSKERDELKNKNTSVAIAIICNIMSHEKLFAELEKLKIDKTIDEIPKLKDDRIKLLCKHPEQIVIH